MKALSRRRALIGAVTLAGAGAVALGSKAMAGAEQHADPVIGLIAEIRDLEKQESVLTNRICDMERGTWVPHVRLVPSMPIYAESERRIREYFGNHPTLDEDAKAAAITEKIAELKKKRAAYDADRDRRGITALDEEFDRGNRRMMELAEIIDRTPAVTLPGESRSSTMRFPTWTTKCGRRGW